MLTLKNRASENLEISLVGDNKVKSDTSLRTSKQAWISDRIFIDPPLNINHRNLKIYHAGYNETDTEIQGVDMKFFTYFKHP